MENHTDNQDRQSRDTGNIEHKTINVMENLNDNQE
jgi:hypothetical protein